MNTWLRLVRGYQTGSSLLAKALEPFEITLAQYDVLVALGSGDGISQQALAERLVISKANLSGILNRLEERELIVRGSDHERTSHHQTRPGQNSSPDQCNLRPASRR
jgi:DNA-binding MarR family transcriptional regulator